MDADMIARPTVVIVVDDDAAILKRMAHAVRRFSFE